MARTYQPIQSRYWENARRKNLTPDEILVELYLVTNQACGPSGVLIAAPSTIAYYTGMSDSVTDLFGCTEVENALVGLQSKERIQLFPGGWIWVVGKWEYEATKTEQVQKAALVELDSAPDTLLNAWFGRYGDTLTVTLTDRVKVRLAVTLPLIEIEIKEEIKEVKDMPSKSDGESKQASEKKHTPYRKRKVKTPAGRMLKLWFGLFHTIYKTEYQGDIRRMSGQMKQLLKNQKEAIIKDTMEYLFAIKQTEYIRHDFDHFIKKFSHYVIEKDK